jgi:hypothetical protein
MTPRALCFALAAAILAAPHSPATAIDALLDTDRATSAAAERTGMAAAVGAVLAGDAIMPVPGRGFAEGREAIITELRCDSLSANGKARWTPVRAGISADGEHGFTFGYLDLLRADGTVVAGKYLAYWIKRPEGWRVAAYKRSRRPDGAIDTSLLPPAAPAALVDATTDSSIVERHRRSLLQAERDFAGEAQVIGLKAAFAKFGSADAMNLGGRSNAAFVLGNVAIAAAVSEGVPDGTSPVHWGPERAFVASSGDLGVTFGRIVPNAAPGEARAADGVPFFTIWRRATPQSPWRYIAE